ncbi:SDR family oxidoreductase [Dongia sedimenti]|uniref:SDR family oxidoreductase n=1 Tax=Dongia sedimenti TaxID=3064282 RepID=A0ABU0YTX2_9PROT|nr:SDR family oxidoreductase [Rhodospirillaceae bacterium R-7]
MDKVVLVTGAGRGIGAAIARAAGKAGYRVVVNYGRSREAAEGVVRDIVSGGGEAIAVQGDVASESDVVRLFQTVDERYGRLDALVNNAGIIGAFGRVDAVTAQSIQELLAINVTGAFICAREAVRRMSTERGGRGGVIVNISSAATTLGAPNEFVPYAASKGAINTMTIGLAKEVGREGIRVIAVEPGLIATEIHESAPAGRLERLGPTVPIGRVAPPEEVAGPVLFLMSDAASYITGTVLRVAGGR